MVVEFLSGLCDFANHRDCVSSWPRNLFLPRKGHQGCDSKLQVLPGPRRVCGFASLPSQWLLGTAPQTPPKASPVPPPGSQQEGRRCQQVDRWPLLPRQPVRPPNTPHQDAGLWETPRGALPPLGPQPRPAHPSLRQFTASDIQINGCCQPGRCHGKAGRVMYGGISRKPGLPPRSSGGCSLPPSL